MQKFKAKFDLDIYKVFQKENYLLIKFNKTEGTQEDFKIITSRILTLLKKNWIDFNWFFTDIILIIN